MMFDITKFNLENAWRGISNVSLIPRRPGVREDLPDDDAAEVLEQMRDCLEGTGGESSARARAASLGQTYLKLNEQGRERFLNLLAIELDIDDKAIKQYCSELIDTTDENDTRNKQNMLRSALTPPRLRLLTQFNSLPSGVKFLVDMRADLLDIENPSTALKALDEDLKSLLTSWFDIGFLDLRRITWDAPAALLEKLMRYEAVHKMQSWQDLKHRLGGDRRCYAYFHPRMPDEPLIFVQVALVSEVAENIKSLIDEDLPIQEPNDAKVAVFYSITNAQTGLKGINLGAFLIKRVVDDLKQEFSNLRTFATLSPVPGLMRYIKNNQDVVQNLITASELKLLHEAFDTDSLVSILKSPIWEIDLEKTDALKHALTRCCAHYLINAKMDNHALDPVANFHLSNGARLERLNWYADDSEKGLKQSAGIMVNYRYKLKDIEKNHEHYSTTGETIVSPTVKALLKNGH